MARSLHHLGLFHLVHTRSSPIGAHALALPQSLGIPGWLLPPALSTDVSPCSGCKEDVKVQASLLRFGSI